MANLLDETLLPRKREWVAYLNGKVCRLVGVVTPSKRAGGNPVVRFRVVAVEPKTTTTEKGQPSAPSYKDVEGALVGELWDFELTGTLKDGTVPTGAIYEALRTTRTECLAAKVSIREYIARIEQTVGYFRAVAYEYEATTRDGHQYKDCSLMPQSL